MKLNRRDFLALSCAGSATVLFSDPARAELPAVNIIAAAPVIRPDLAYQFLGIPMGYFEKLGFKADFMTVAGSAAAMQLIVAGSGTVASIGMLELISAKISQPTLPIKCVFMHDKVSPYPVVVAPESPIMAVKDFVGKSIGVANMASGAIPTTRALLKQAGVDEKSVTFLPVGTGAQALASLKSKQVDAVSGFVGQIVAMELLGQQFRSFSLTLPASGFIMRSDFVEKSRELAVRVLQGMLLNQIIMERDPAAVVRAVWKMTGKPHKEPDRALFEGEQYIKRLTQTYKTEAEPGLWGDLSDEDWTHLKTYASDVVPPDGAKRDYFDSRLLAAANEVDRSLADQAIQNFRT